MVRHLSHILLIILVLVNGMGYTFIQVDFILNQKQIAELFCVNKDKPELSCDGKCELGRRLEGAKETEESKKTLVQEQNFFVFVVPEVLSVVNNLWIDYQLVMGMVDQSEHGLIEFGDFFHPPRG